MDRITLYGKIVFEPEDATKKHKEQASWKKIAMIMFEGDLAEYYAWFLNKRYSIILNKPLRGAHISFINDSLKDMSLGGKRSSTEVETLWKAIKTKWNGQTIPIVLSLDPRTDDNHWWLNIPHDERGLLHGIREELGLGKPYWGLHMSLGYANEKNLPHSKYIHDLIKKGFIKS